MWLFFAVLQVAFWGADAIVDSILVKHYEKDPLVLLWFTGLFKIFFLLIFAMFFPLQTSWLWPLLLLGPLYYASACLMVWMLDRVDVSMMNIAWALQSISLSIVGLVALHEVWSVSQTAGAVLIIGGVLFLTQRQKTMPAIFMVLLLGAIGVLIVPEEYVKKAALLQGQAAVAVFFWPLLGNAIASLIAPLTLKRFRRKFTMLFRRPLSFYLLSMTDTIAVLAANYFLVLAYLSGTLSLVSIVNNLLPFAVILFAWLLYRFAPHFAPREVLTAQSLWVKICSFGIIFCGLALLG